ncbi:hypothetical protein LOK49_LG15G01234 [Camellia lanceoleosa]|uniref:Uncharacterized protein n=1 Tax=Camellia lanceoleosa TaxID=1840588 RepID=A0ACC0F1W1_9ERIC|nr:hypothetical protein LOK49_LG15G01234 [Camellia lanceoleosa]
MIERRLANSQVKELIEKAQDKLKLITKMFRIPQAILEDPFRKGNNILIICDACTPADEPIPTNKRYHAEKIFSHPDVVAEEPWHGIEQEYTLFQKDVKRPIGWPKGGYPGPQGPYYCGAGANKAFWT